MRYLEMSFKRGKKCKIPYWKGKMLLRSSEAGKFLVCTAAGVKNVKLCNIRKAKDSTSWIQNPTFTDSFSYPFVQSILVLLYIFITSGWMAWYDVWNNPAFYFTLTSLLSSSYVVWWPEYSSGNTCITNIQVQMKLQKS